MRAAFLAAASRESWTDPRLGWLGSTGVRTSPMAAPAAARAWRLVSASGRPRPEIVAGVEAACRRRDARPGRRPARQGGEGGSSAETRARWPRPRPRTARRRGRSRARTCVRHYERHRGRARPRGGELGVREADMAPIRPEGATPAATRRSRNEPRRRAVRGRVARDEGSRRRETSREGGTRGRRATVVQAADGARAMSAHRWRRGWWLYHNTPRGCAGVTNPSPTWVLIFLGHGN